jgi:hypothetical protein
VKLSSQLNLQLVVCGRYRREFGQSENPVLVSYTRQGIKRYLMAAYYIIWGLAVPLLLNKFLATQIKIARKILA